jgi:hypothetical protein
MPNLKPLKSSLNTHSSIPINELLLSKQTHNLFKGLYKQHKQKVLMCTLHEQAVYFIFYICIFYKKASWVWDPMRWVSSIYLILPATLDPGVYSASNRNQYQKLNNNLYFGWMHPVACCCSFLLVFCLWFTWWWLEWVIRDNKYTLERSCERRSCFTYFVWIIMFLGSSASA